MIQRQLKLRLTKTQETTLDEWIWILTGVWNWAVRKIELDAQDGIYYSPKDFQNLLANHSKKLGIPSHTLQGMLTTAYTAWQRCWKKLAKKPRLKGQRNQLNGIPFPDPFRPPQGNRIKVPGIGSVRFHRQDIPEGKIKCGRIIKRSSGWYLCLFIDAEPNSIPVVGDNQIGIDFGYTTLATFSTGEKIKHPRELQMTAKRFAQAQRGSRKQLAARLRERESNRRKDRNHKLSRRLVSENAVIVVSKDSLRGLARNHFGKSVTAASHGQLRHMLSSKCTKSGRTYIEVSPKNSTRICSLCRSLSGPTGWTGLSVRQWECSACGADHDRDVNAARNTLTAGLGSSLEHAGDRISGT